MDHNSQAVMGRGQSIEEQVCKYEVDISIFLLHYQNERAFILQKMGECVETEAQSCHYDQTQNQNRYQK